MRKLIIPAILCLLLACKEEPPSYQVMYEVTVDSCNSWIGEYIDETGEKKCFCEPPLPQSGWTYSFEVIETPFTLHIDATSDCGLLEDWSKLPDATSSIYVNGELVATNTSNWAPGVSSADYVIE